MMTVLGCITDDHAPWLVFAAMVVCITGSWSTVRLFGRAAAATGSSRAGWHVLAAVAAGAAVWCTHFIAMLGYDPGVPVAYDPALAVFSLLVATAGAAAGLVVAAGAWGRFAPALGGGILGLAIAAMHYTGMMAYRVQGVVSWDLPYLAASILLAVVFSAAALHLATRRIRRVGRAAASGALALAIVGLHFTGMTAFRVEPMLVDGSFSDPAALQALAFAIAGVAVVVFVPGFATRLIDDHSRAESAQALRNMSNGLVMVSGRGTIRLYNDRVLSLFGLAPDELRVGMPMSRFLRNIGARVGWDEARTQRVIDNHGQWMARDATTRVEHHFEDGRILSISCRPTGGGGAIITYDDVTEAREGQKKIAHLAYHDALTGLPNRRSFTDRVVRLSRQSSFAMLMLDLDRFKAVNDTLGHPVGDELLVQVVARLRGVCGDADLAFRLGGDEFGLLTTRQQAEAHALADGIVRALAAPFQIGEHLVSIGASVGMATSPCGGDTDLVQRMADLALYKAKENGRGRVEVYREGMIEEAAARRRLEADLVGAVEAGQLELHYQPLFDLPGRALSGFEALLRWHHPERGTVPPGEFIPIAEQCGAIVDIGAWVIDEACRQAALWPAHIYVSVNVSPVQLRSPDILWQLTRSLDRHGLTPRRIEVEVTETAMIENSEAIATVLAGLRALGVRIAMDDFGTGYSSLAHLRAFKLDRIKIDRSFVSGSHADAGSAAVVRAVTAMARDLAIATTGEGVESEEQLANLIELGCGAAQGFLLGRPLDAAGATGLVAGRPGAAKRLTS